MSSHLVFFPLQMGHSTTHPLAAGQPLVTTDTWLDVPRLPTINGPEMEVNTKAGGTPQPKGVTNKKLPPSLPPLCVKSSPAAEGGAKSQVTHPPLTALDSNPADPLNACTRDKTKVAAKIRPSNQERRFPERPASRIPQDLKTKLGNQERRVHKSPTASFVQDRTHSPSPTQAPPKPLPRSPPLPQPKPSRWAEAWNTK